MPDWTRCRSITLTAPICARRNGTGERSGPGGCHSMIPGGLDVREVGLIAALRVSGEGGKVLKPGMPVRAAVSSHPSNRTFTACIPLADFRICKSAVGCCGLEYNHRIHTSIRLRKFKARSFLAGFLFFPDINVLHFQHSRLLSRPALFCWLTASPGLPGIRISRIANM